MELFAKAEFDGLLQTDDVLVFGKFNQGVGVHVAGGTARNVVNHDLGTRFAAERAVVLQEAFLRRVVVVASHAEDCHRGNLLDVFNHFDRFTSAVGTGTGNHGHAAVHIVERKLDDIQVLLRRDRRTLTRGHGREHATCTVGNHVVNHLTHLLVVDGIAKVLGVVVLERSEQRGENTSKLRSVSNLHSAVNI